MLKIVVPDRTGLFNEETNEFVTIKGDTLLIEHSLISISKWEQKWKKPFMETPNKTFEEILDYIGCMLLKPVNPEIFLIIPTESFEEIVNYINDPMTATTISSSPFGNAKNGNELVTSELIYYWMVALHIPFECEKWHLNRLITLIKVCSVKQNPPKKMSKKAEREQREALNRARRAKYGTRG